VFEEIDKAATVLADDTAGWVHRRDAADLLGRIAARALRPLHEHSDEMDLDVRASVERALGQAQAALQGVQAVPPTSAFSFDELARLCAKDGARTVSHHETGYVVDVKLKDGRGQRVYLMPDKRKDESSLIRVFTYCGEASAEAERWALYANNKLTHCAVALVKEDGKERFVLTRSFMEGDVTPSEMRRAVKEVAFYGDWIEGKLSGLDDF